MKAAQILGEALVGVAGTAVMMVVLFAGLLAALKGVYLLWMVTSEYISPLFPSVAILFYWTHRFWQIDDEDEYE